MEDLRILTIQDISCVGQCSLTVALPILSACGIETAALPSAVLSTHTGGFSGYTFRDLTDDMPAIAAHWRKEGIRFDAFYTGYLGSARQIGYVSDILSGAGKEGSVTVVDPAMADNGKLYAGFDGAFVEAMKGLAGRADYLLPNLTEACLLTGSAYRETWSEADMDALLRRLREVCPGTIVLTGVSRREGRTGVAVRAGEETQYYEHRKIARGCHGTGDVFASAFTGALLRGAVPLEAARIAADYTAACIEDTVGDESHWYGVKFERSLPKLMRALESLGA